MYVAAVTRRLHSQTEKVLKAKQGVTHSRLRERERAPYNPKQLRHFEGRSLAGEVSLDCWGVVVPEMLKPSPGQIELSTGRFLLLSDTLQLHESQKRSLHILIAVAAHRPTVFLVVGLHPRNDLIHSDSSFGERREMKNNREGKSKPTPRKSGEVP